MITAVCGGKGGTGKSTYAILLAMRRKALLVDTDVENPSLHLLLGVDVGKEIAKVYTRKPKLIKEKCRKCGICVKACKFNAIFMPKDGYPVFIHDLCEGCTVCSVVCPFGAIVMEKEEIGAIYYNEEAGLVTGMGEEAREVAKRVIEEVKKMARDVVIDCPAGIHCNVLNQMIEADEVIIVTEPTPLGVSGLKVALETLEELGKNAKVVVNKFEENENSEKIEKICRRYGAEIIEKIPYSDELARAYASGKLLSILEGMK